MKQKTFTREIIFLEKIPTFFEDGRDPEINRQPVKKMVQFKELDQCDSEQFDLHFNIMGYCTEGMATPKGKSKKKLTIDPAFSREMAEAFLQDMAIIDEEFTAKDRDIALGDSGCLCALGLWLVPTKILPFFLELMRNSFA